MIRVIEGAVAARHTDPIRATDLHSGDASRPVLGVDRAPEARADGGVSNDPTVSLDAVDPKRNIGKRANSGPAGPPISDDRVGRGLNDVVDRSAILPAPLKGDRRWGCTETASNEDDGT